MSRFTSKSARVQVLKRDLANILRWMRRVTGDSSADVAARMQQVLTAHKMSPESVLPVTARVFLSRGVDAVEDSGEGTIELGYSDLTFLSESYTVHRLLLDPVLTRPSQDLCLVQSFRDFLEIGEESDPKFGERSIYRIPRRKPANSDSIAVVDLTIEAGGKSDSHWHAGEELIFLLHGAVEVLFQDVGLRAKLSTNDYLHFYSEHQHCVLNESRDSAHLFIVRFRPSTNRLEFLRELESPRPSVQLIHRAFQELRKVISPKVEAVNPWSFTISDRVGLGQFLRLLASEGFRGPKGRLTLDSILEKCKGTKYTRSKIHRIMRGTSPVELHDLHLLSRIFECEPVLLYDFLIPTHRPAVVVRESTDMLAVPPEFARSARSTYKIPRRRLADTDTSIALLELPPFGETPENCHPGFEVLLPLRVPGGAAVEFGDTAAAIPEDFQGYICFRSDHPHKVVNNSDLTASLLVVRTYN